MKEDPEIQGWLDRVLEGETPLPPGARQGSEGKAIRARMKRYGFPLAVKLLTAQGLGPASIAVRIGKSRSWVARILEAQQNDESNN